MHNVKARSVVKLSHLMQVHNAALIQKKNPQVPRYSPFPLYSLEVLIGKSLKTNLLMLTLPTLYNISKTEVLVYQKNNFKR